ncbi:MAG: hypothetical protein R2734_18850 [Nocardioides sp.]
MEKLVAESQARAAQIAEDADHEHARRTAELAELDRVGRLEAERAVQVLHAEAQNDVNRVRSEADDRAREIVARRRPRPRRCAPPPRSTTRCSCAGRRSGSTRARAEADRHLASAAEHTAWADDTVRSLLSAAQQEAELGRSRAHRETTTALAARRRQLQDVVARSAERLRQRIAEAERQALEVEERGRKTAAEAEADAERVREQARADSDRARAEAAEQATEMEERAQLRLDKIESGAKTLQEQIAAEVMRSQHEAQEVLARARQEADELHALAAREREVAAREALELLDEAKAEVETLERRRDAIVAELGGLSGVIQALAVPDPTSLQTRTEGVASAALLSSTDLDDLTDLTAQHPHPTPED